MSSVGKKRSVCTQTERFFLLEHKGQPVAFFARSITLVFHSCPHFGHSHQTRLFEPGVTCSGVRVSFFDGCHSFATFGQQLAKSLCPIRTTRLAHTGQPVPLCALVVTMALHSC